MGEQMMPGEEQMVELDDQQFTEQFRNLVTNADSVPDWAIASAVKRYKKSGIFSSLNSVTSITIKKHDRDGEEKWFVNIADSNGRPGGYEIRPEDGE